MALAAVALANNLAAVALAAGVGLWWLRSTLLPGSCLLSASQSAITLAAATAATLAAATLATESLTATSLAAARTALG